MKCAYCLVNEATHYCLGCGQYVCASATCNVAAAKAAAARGMLALKNSAGAGMQRVSTVIHDILNLKP